MARRLAFIGLGAMGAPMAARLVQAGFDVAGCDLRPEALARLRGLGGRPAATPAQAARGAAAAIVMVHDTRQAEAVLFGPDGLAAALAPGAAVWLASTLRPAEVPSWARRLRSAGLHCVDGPVSGGVSGAEQGRLTVIAGADEPAMDALREVMAACAAVVHRVGEPGAGSAVKAVNNMLAASHLALTAEALSLGRAMGVDLGLLCQVVEQSSGVSYMFTRRAGRMVAGEHTPHVTLRTFLKDIDLALEMAGDRGVDLPVALSAQRVLSRAADAGLLDESDTRLFEACAAAGAACPAGPSEPGRNFKQTP